MLKGKSKDLPLASCRLEWFLICKLFAVTLPAFCFLFEPSFIFLGLSPFLFGFSLVVLLSAKLHIFQTCSLLIGFFLLLKGMLNS